MNPDQVIALYGMANVDLHRAQESADPAPLRQQAEKQRRRALKLRPDYTLASRLLAQVYAEQGDAAAAIAVLEKSERVQGSPGVRRDLQKLRKRKTSAPTKGA